MWPRRILFATVLLVACGRSRDVSLMKAAQDGDLASVRRFLAAGANSNLKDSQRRAPPASCHRR